MDSLAVEVFDVGDAAAGAAAAGAGAVVVVVALVGAADLGGADVLQRNLTTLGARRPRRTVFDLSRLTMISSLSIGALIAYHRGVHARGGRVVLAAANETVAGALRRCRLDQIMPMTPTVEAALADVPASG